MRFKEKLVWDSENRIRFGEKKCYKYKKFLLNALVFFVHSLLKVAKIHSNQEIYF